MGGGEADGGVMDKPGQELVTLYSSVSSCICLKFSIIKCLKFIKAETFLTQGFLSYWFLQHGIYFLRTCALGQERRLWDTCQEWGELEKRQEDHHAGGRKVPQTLLPPNT